MEKTADILPHPPNASVMKKQDVFPKELMRQPPHGMAVARTLSFEG